MSRVFHSSLACRLASRQGCCRPGDGLFVVTDFAWDALKMLMKSSSVLQPWAMLSPGISPEPGLVFRHFPKPGSFGCPPLPQMKQEGLRVWHIPPTTCHSAKILSWSHTWVCPMSQWTTGVLFSQPCDHPQSIPVLMLYVLPWSTQELSLEAQGSVRGSDTFFHSTVYDLLSYHLVSRLQPHWSLAHRVLPSS